MNQKNKDNELGELHPKEKKLILRLRNEHPWGELTIEMRGGIPDRITEVVRYKKL